MVYIYRNENIISYKEAFMENHTSTLCIVMEYADGGDLLQKITKCK
jgi:NIMA (never in mitosis gene a)-related kinase 1/4/5